MAVVYSELQTTAFTLVDPTELNRSYFILRFPAIWKKHLEALIGRSAGDQPSYIPIRSLNRTLIALIPDIVAMASYATRGENPIWIVSDRPVPAQALFPVVAAWLRVTGRRNPAVLERVLGAIGPDDLRWESLDVDFARQVELLASRDPEVRANAEQAVFKLLPHQLAARLSEPGRFCDHNGATTSAFRRCPTGHGAQIMSWPPHLPDNKPFSFTIGLTAQSLPLDREVVVHASFGVRRWVHRTPVLDTKNFHSVYINPSVPWIKGQAYSPSFQRAGIRLRIEGSGEMTQRTAHWSDMLTAVLTEIGAQGHSANVPDAVRTKPRELLDLEQGGVALVYREGMYTFPGKQSRGHPVKPGLALTDRPRLLDWLAAETTGMMQLGERLTRSETTALPGLRKRPEHTDEQAQKSLRTSVAKAIDAPRLRVEIYYDTRATLDQAVSALQDQLGIKFSLPDTRAEIRATISVETPELGIALTIRPVGQLAADLDPKPAYKNIVERMNEAVRRRANEIQTVLEPLDAGEIAVALVEIGGLGQYKGARRKLDPKFAIRHGFNLAGRLTQFLEPVDDQPDQSEPEETTSSESGDAARLRKCAEELWRQLGARRSPIPQPNTSQIQQYLAFYIIRQNRRKVWGTTRQVPVAVRMAADGSRIEIKAPEVEWMPLARGLLEVGRRHVMAGQTRKPEAITNFFREILTNDLDLSVPTLLLTAAQNTRYGWSFLNNRDLVADHVRFSDKEAPWPVVDTPGLRHVRIRTNMYDETPEGYAVNEKKRGHTGAPWRRGDRLWYSTADKPNTASNALNLVSMVESVPYLTKNGEEATRPATPGSRVWNGQLVEIALAALQPDDIGHEEWWATLVHELRLASPFHHEATVLPWPLHLAEKIGEYIVPVRFLEEVQEEEEPAEREERPDTD
ncbi:pPIWI_RE module domain-containing protein [Nonomuraea sp. NPDC050556]|uniref:pPIWI_RE module domain-containing protein n=1 Tax=Nonomuraea sp. NPDC050556 TaxID=3364369 RepID=UPI00378D103A